MTATFTGYYHCDLAQYPPSPRSPNLGAQIEVARYFFALRDKDGSSELVWVGTYELIGHVLLKPQRLRNTFPCNGKKVSEYIYNYSLSMKLNVANLVK